MVVLFLFSSSLSCFVGTFRLIRLLFVFLQLQKRPEVRVANGCKKRNINKLKRKEMQTCQCPQSAALTTISPVTCAERFGQTQKVIFQRLLDDHGNRNGIDEPRASDVDTWVTQKGERDSTKIVVTPFIENPTPDGGDAKTVGGGNASLNGAETVIGSNPVGMTFDMNNMPQSVI